MLEHKELLKKNNFESQLNKLCCKLKNKKILIYGAGLFLKSVKENYDLSSLNIIGISDKKYKIEQYNELDFDYKIVPYSKIKEIEFDCVLIATLNTFNIYQNLKKDFKNKKIIILPLMEKTFFELLKEAFFL
ncbi:MAG: hypothetical protein IJB79_02170 [Candidatus Gastranaerophilales bacterium]|nr:hypothetical protein [Candidatus Gastranaerophilales bacterium]